MKILVTGASGQLGSEIRGLSAEFADTFFVFMDRGEMPLDDLVRVKQVLEEVKPSVIINAGAYTAVDRAESEPVLADLVNHQAPAVMADWVADHDSRMVHISTDYVFSGLSSIPLKEEGPTQPINEYGRSKQRGEQAILVSGADAVVIRTAWLYSTYGTNFVKTMLRLMEERDEITVVADQIGSPTYARDLAKVVLDIVHAPEWQPGIYHYSNEGEASWYDFAVAIRDLKGLECRIKPVTTEQYPTPAKRPKYSLLDKTKIKETFGLKVPHWRESLKDMLIKF